MSIEVKINDKPLQDLLTRLLQKLGNMKPAMNAIGEAVVESVQTNFESGGRPLWPKLAKSTIKQRINQGKWPGLILVRSGVSGGLFGSIHHTPFSDRVIITAGKKYAALHQFGAAKGQFGTHQVDVDGHIRRTKYGKVSVKPHSRKQAIPWGNIPARPFLMVQDQDWQTIRQSLTQFLFRA